MVGAGALGVLAAAAIDGDVTEGSAMGPVPATGLIEVARLRVVVVAKLGVGEGCYWPVMVGAARKWVAVSVTTMWCYG